MTTNLRYGRGTVPQSARDIKREGNEVHHALGRTVLGFVPLQGILDCRKKVTTTTNLSTKKRPKGKHRSREN